MILQKLHVLLLVALIFETSAFSSSPLNLAKSHGSYCHLCEDLIKDGKEAGDVALDVWLDEEIGRRCKNFGVLESNCLKELKTAEKDIWEAIDQDIPENSTCKSIDLC